MERLPPRRFTTQALHYDRIPGPVVPGPIPDEPLAAAVENMVSGAEPHEYPHKNLSFLIMPDSGILVYTRCAK